MKSFCKYFFEAQWNKDILTLRKKLAGKCTDRQKMTEQFRNRTEDNLANIIKRIKVEDTVSGKIKFYLFVYKIERRNSKHRPG